MKIESVILCDDIRVEDTRKHLLIGVYLNDVVVSQFDAALIFRLWVQFYPDKEGDLSLEVRMKGTAIDKSPLFRGIINIDKKDELATLRLPQMPIIVTREGELEFQIREKGKRWKTAKRISVRKESL